MLNKLWLCYNINKFYHILGFDDNETPDDIILGLVYDRETAIYDALETALSDEFEIERNDNNIRISILKEVK